MNPSGEIYWTADQRRAIEARSANLLVSAAAGAGKTAVLVERVISYLDEGVDVDRLLVVTFTEAAAAEMKHRIASAIQKRMAGDQGSDFWRRQWALLNRASVSTLHSFCLQTLRRHFYRLDLDPRFKVAGEREATLLKYETVEKLFEDYYNRDDNRDFTFLVDSYGGMRGDESLQEMILQLFDFTRALPWPEEWLAKMAARFKVQGDRRLAELSWGKVVLEDIHLCLQRAGACLTRAMELAGSQGGPVHYRVALTDDLQLVQNLAIACRKGDWDQLYSLGKSLSFSRLSAGKKSGMDESLKTKVQGLRNEAKKIIASVKKNYLMVPPAQIIKDLHLVGPVMGALTGVVRDLEAAYRKAKVSRGMVDFSDLEHYCLRLFMDPASTVEQLIPSGVAREVGDYFREVLVDEYQDINAVQEIILHLASRQDGDNPNLFMVGDVKQSIYRFRSAEPGLFQHKFNAYPRISGSRDLCVCLKSNFRCRQEIIHGINYLFRQLMCLPIAEIEYDDEAQLEYSAGYPPTPGGQEQIRIECHLLERNPAHPENPYLVPETDENDDDTGEGVQEAEEKDQEDLLALEQEGAVIGRRIREMVLGSGKNGPQLIWDAKTTSYRPLNYGDIAVLLRATRNRSNLLLEIFRRMGIPAHADLDTGYFTAVEVQNMLSLLRVIDNPHQDIPLAAVLRSPLVGLSAAALAQIRLCCRDGDFYYACQVAAQELGPSDLVRQLRLFGAKLAEWRTMARRGTLGQLIDHIYNDTGYLDFVGGMPDGLQRQANLCALLDRAEEFDQFARQGLSRFLRFVQKLQDNKADLGAVHTVGADEKAVRVISIHKSKGLEFPVVFVVDLGKRFNRQELRRDLLLHRQLGLGPVLVDPETRLAYPTIAHKAIALRLKQESLAEEMRVLYVAMTRARERLILVGSTRRLMERLEKWSDAASQRGRLLPEACLAGANTYLDWIGPALLRHRDAGALRELAGCVSGLEDFQPGADPSRWKVIIYGLAGGHRQPEVSRVKAGPVELLDKVIKLLPLEGVPENQLAGELFYRLGWRYPYQEMVNKTAKVTVSELKDVFTACPEEQETAGHLVCLRRPAFLQRDTGLTSLERGSAVHLALQHLDLNGPLDVSGVKNQLGLMVEREIITPEQVAAVSVEEIALFFKTSLGSRLLARPRDVRREVAFSLGIPVPEVHQDVPAEVAGDSRVLAQGIIDCLVREDDGFLLIDFKTGQAGDWSRQYRGQIGLYTRAVEEIFRMPVKEAYLYFMSTGRAIKV